MRLWHHQVLCFLPKGQLLAQWRELNSVFAKEDRHILINYIYDCPKEDLYVYTQMVLSQMQSRGYQVRTVDKMQRYFGDVNGNALPSTPFARYHDNEYLDICYYNLYEKFLRGQKDFDESLFLALKTFWLNARQDAAPPSVL